MILMQNGANFNFIVIKNTVLVKSYGIRRIQIMQRFIAVTFLAVITAGTLCAQGLTPQSPEIQEAVKKGIAFLEKNGAAENRQGGQALIGMAVLKSGADAEHPLIRRAVEAIRKSISSSKVEMSDPIYSVGLSVMFLSDLDADKYRAELDALCRFLQNNQRSDGSWSYLTSGSPDGYPSGDMSMTQYGVLAYWTLRENQFPVPDLAINKVARWLLNAQDPNTGTYAYQTTMSKDFSQITRSDMKPSTTAAGMASLYACRELFGMNNLPAKKSPAQEIPAVFVKIPRAEEEMPQGDKAISRMSVDFFEKAQSKGDNWLRDQFSPLKKETQYLHYYLYAIERYWSFREIAEKKIEESPAWYNTASRFLLREQASDGSWNSSCGATVDTAFAVLTLLRSTRLSIAKEKSVIARFSSSNMIGGKGLPRSTEDVRIRDGQIVSLRDVPDVDQLAEALNAMEEFDDESIAKIYMLSNEELHSLLEKQNSSLMRFASAADANTRLSIVSMISQSGDIKHIPLLLYAMTDPDENIAQKAYKAALRITRTLDDITIEKLKDRYTDKK